MKSRSRLFLAALLALSSSLSTALPAAAVAATNLPSGHFTWTGADAATFVAPFDLRKAGSWHDAKFNLDYTSYQQYAAPLGILVDGAQVTIVSRAGKQLIVSGAYYPGVHSTAPLINAAQANALAASLRGGIASLPDVLKAVATQRADLRLDPDTGRPFYLVANAAPGANSFQQVDAQTGQLIAAWSGVDQVSPVAGQGVGVKGDIKQLSNPAQFASVGGLTTNSSGYKLQSADGKFVTYDAMGGNAISGNPVMTDVNNGNDDIWQSANEAAGVDAQYYAALTVQFYRQELGYDWLTGCTVDNAHNTVGWPSKVRSVVHYDQSPNSTPFDNAFWDQDLFYMVYGDGSLTDRPLSAGQDVVSHELSHAVTQCNSNLDYQKESGALNESFSDIMATAAEWIMDEPNSSNCRIMPGETGCPDWDIGEDLARTNTGAIIRSLADPEVEGQPSHYEDRQLPSAPCNSGNDECGVHTNSGISNHAFYLMANGGRNARCSGPTDPQDDCDVMVPPTSIDHATQIFFAGFMMLTSEATFCDARNATIAQAAVLYPNSVTDIAATILAWQAVGLGANCDHSTDFTVSLSDPTIELAPNHGGQTQLSLVRGTDNTQVNYTTDWVGPATVSALPTSNAGGNSAGSQITVNADMNAADGTYPFLITATGLAAHYAAGSFVVDSQPPTAAVTGAAFINASQVSTAGSIPLSVTWSASDNQSGIASKELDQSPNGSGWGSIGTTSPTTYGATAGPHQFEVVATDAVGNTTTSAALVRTLTGFQENDSHIVYTGTWLTNTEATPWGTTKYSTHRRATATLTFTGNTVVWITQRGPKRGVANVFVDGVKTHVDLYSATLTERKVAFIATNLSAGTHTIKIKVMATYRRPRVDVDGFFVLG